eukprot:scaffold5716_cov94-Phaeocystis_antarctica.AAC.1
MFPPTPSPVRTTPACTTPAACATRVRLVRLTAPMSQVIQGLFTESPVSKADTSLAHEDAHRVRSSGSDRLLARQKPYNHRRGGVGGRRCQPGRGPGTLRERAAGHHLDEER